MRAAPEELAPKGKLPSFREWRVGGPKQGKDAAMVPDRGFVKQLHALDPELWPLWDWGANKWEIWRFPRNGQPEFHVMTVQTQGRSYRELGADVLLKLQEGDPTRFTTAQLIAYFDEMDEQILRRKRKQLKDKIEDMALDSFVNIHCKIIQVPKEMKVRRVLDGKS